MVKIMKDKDREKAPGFINMSNIYSLLENTFNGMKTKLKSTVYRSDLLNDQTGRQIICIHFKGY
jgi:hypothetical protein